MKHVKLFEDYTCKYFSDAMRMDSVEVVLNAIKAGDYEDYTEEPDYDMLLDPDDGYDKQTYVQYVEEDNQIIYWEGWSKLCWSALYQKKEYKGLSKEKAANKMADERLIPSIESMGLKLENSEFFWAESNSYDVQDGYITKVTFSL